MSYTHAIGIRHRQPMHLDASFFGLISPARKPPFLPAAGNHIYLMAPGHQPAGHLVRADAARLGRGVKYCIDVSIKHAYVTQRLLTTLKQSIIENQQLARLRIPVIAILHRLPATLPHRTRLFGMFDQPNQRLRHGFRVGWVNA